MKNTLITLVTLCAFALPAQLSAQTTLAIDPLYPNGDANFHLSNGTADSWMYVCYSLAGSGPTTLAGGLQLDLSTPFTQLNPLQLDSNGNATLGPLPVPSTIAIGTQIWFQGVEFNIYSNPMVSTTNMVPMTIEQTPPPPGVNMVHILGGNFDMGNHSSTNVADELPIHTVSVDDFYMDVYEVTNQEYAFYLNSAYALGTITVTNNVIHQVGGAAQALADTNDSDTYSKIDWDGSTFYSLSGYADHPLVLVSWFGACHYANWRSVNDGFAPSYNENTWACNFSGNGYRLPTEAEWEYAARGGSTTYYTYPWNRNDINANDANYDWNVGSTSPVGDYDPNGFGLYDTSGNAWEWCNDWYADDYYALSPTANPTGPGGGIYRVVRGGSWFYGEMHLRSAARSTSNPAFMFYYFGFRLLTSRP